MNRMDNDLYDDNLNDSMVLADFSPCRTLERKPITMDHPKAKETPIESEIRRAIEREQSLRRSRGIQNSPTTTEFVDIPLRKSILSQSLPSKWERSQGNDRHFAGKKMQKEIQSEAQREQVLVKLGKVPGVYDKGTVRELKERKLLFEAFQDPKYSCLNLTQRNKASTNDLSTLEKQNMFSQGESLERRQSADLLSQMHSAKEAGGSTFRSTQGPGLSEETSCQVIILVNNQVFPGQHLQTSRNSHLLTDVEEHTVIEYRTRNPSSGMGEHCGYTKMEEEGGEQKVDEEIRSKENPFFKLRSCAALDKMELEIREARERERELRRQRDSVYGCAGIKGLRGGQGGKAADIKRQITTFPAPLNRQGTTELPIPPSREASGIPAGHQSLANLGMWPPTQPVEKQIN